jgi:uncharacterized membrane protein YesL
MKFKFDIDSKLWKFFDHVGDLVLLNLVFMLTSLPVFTTGASITAMDSVLFKIKEKRTDSPCKEYFNDFKANFKNSTIIWLGFLMFLFACILNFNLITNTNPDNRGVILVVLGAVFAVLFMTVLYSFAMLARFDNDLLTTISKAFAISIMSFPCTLSIFLVITAAFVVGIQTYLTLLVAASIWLIIGFALLGYFCCTMFYRAFRRFTWKEDLEKGEGNVTD